MSCNCKKKLPLAFKKLREDAIIPRYESESAAGMDLAVIDSVTIFPRDKKLVKLGWAVAVPEGYEMQIRPRSGLSLKTGLRISNSPGTIDSDYRGEVGVIVENVGVDPITFYPANRIAQAVIAPVVRCDITVELELSETDRGAGGLGQQELNKMEDDFFPEKIDNAEDIIQAAYDDLEEEIVRKDSYRNAALSLMDLQAETKVLNFRGKRQQQRENAAAVTVVSSKETH